MHRNVIIREYSLEYDPLLHDQESLLIQLCDHLFRSGFVFYDSTETEIEAGGSVIGDFFDQERELLRELVSRKRFKSFNDYLNNFGWSKELLKKKLRLRILKAFDQLAKGKHHHFNIRYNIAQALCKPENNALYDLLLYIEMYHNLILAKKQTKAEDALEEVEFKKKNFKLEDLMHLRSQLQERLEGRKLVKGFLKHIAKARGVSPESLVPYEKKQQRTYPPIIFIRPSKQTSSPVKDLDVILPDINKTPEKTVAADELGITSTADGHGQQTEIILEPDLEQFGNAPAFEIAEANNVEEVPEDNLRKLNSYVTLFAEDEEETKDEEIGDISKSANFEAKSVVQSAKVSLSSAELKDELDETTDKDFIEDDGEDFLVDSFSDDDVVFGSKKITNTALEKFVRQYADSALKFLLQRNLDGRPLPAGIEEVYSGWEKRGLSRKHLKNYVLKLMELTEIPDIPILDLLQKLRDCVYEVSKKNKS